MQESLVKEYIYGCYGGDNLDLDDNSVYKRLEQEADKKAEDLNGAARIFKILKERFEESIEITKEIREHYWDMQDALETIIDEETSIKRDGLSNIELVDLIDKEYNNG